MKTLELFSGSGKISRSLSARGFETITVDIRKRKGVCEPTLRADIMKLPADFFKGQGIKAVWASTPCPAHSVASGNRYFANLVPKEEAKPFLKLLDKTIEIIEAINPEYFFIENPRGRMRYNKHLVDFMAHKGAMVKQTAWGLYGGRSVKPTDIFTNALDFVPLNGFKWGRGAKYGLEDFANLTLHQKQEIPTAFAEHLATYLEGKFKDQADFNDQADFKGQGTLSINY